MLSARYLVSEERDRADCLTKCNSRKKKNTEKSNRKNFKPNEE
jgi:hypothetical protein